MQIYCVRDPNQHSKIANGLRKTDHASENENRSLSSTEDCNVYRFFRLLVWLLYPVGFCRVSKESTASVFQGSFVKIWKCLISIYILAVWMWAVVNAVSVVYTAVHTAADSSSADHHKNMIVSLLEESPYVFITFRNVTVLTFFVSVSSRIHSGIDLCETLRIKITHSGGNLQLKKIYRIPVIFLLTAFITILLWEVHEWCLWFSTLGIFYVDDFVPFPFQIFQYQFAALWYAFTTLPFLIAQTVLCFPVAYAVFLRRCMQFVNQEIKQVIKSSRADATGLLRIQLGERVRQLRSLHYEVCRVARKVDQAISGMLLASYIFDVLVLFGFLGLLVNSKDARPSPSRIEWTFYLSSSVLWFVFFLFNFSIPLIRMAEEGDKTYHLVHAVTVSSTQLLKEQFTELSIFLSESRQNSFVFTGHRFYYINRHYIVATVALTASYLTVLTEILDRYYGTESLKSSLAILSTVVTNATSMAMDININDTNAA